MKKYISEETKNKVVQLYSNNVKIDDIVSSTKLSIATIYRILSSKGCPRQRKSDINNDKLDQIFSAISDLQNQVTKLQESIDDIRTNLPANNHIEKTITNKESTNAVSNYSNDDLAAIIKAMMTSFLSLNDIKKEKNMN